VAAVRTSCERGLLKGKLHAMLNYWRHSPAPLFTQVPRETV
jgi:hypothetical protein